MSAWTDAVSAIPKATDWLWWRLNETSGTNADDASPNNYDGTHSGSTITLGETGLLTADSDLCAKYTGTTGITQRAQAAWMNNANFSIVGLFKSGTLNANNVLAARDHQSNGRVFQIQLSSAGVVSFIIIASVGSVYTITTPASYADGVRHLYVATYNQAQDQQTGKMNICIDAATRVTGGGANNINLSPTACPLSCGAAARTTALPAQSWLDEFIYLPGIVLQESHRQALWNAAQGITVTSKAGWGVLM